MYCSDNYYPFNCDFPRHIALIPDGGRRWAMIRKCTITESYSYSMKKIRQFIDWAFSAGASCFSVYMASTYNFRRTADEVSAFCESEWAFICNDFLPYAVNNDIKIRIVGTRDSNIQEYLNRIDMVEEKTSRGKRTVNFCFNYISYDEMETAFRRSTEKSIFFANNLDIPCPVNLLIRTGGANVLSGFLLPQVAFARLYFEKKLFNDFSIEDFQSYVDEYIKLELKYGE